MHWILDDAGRPVEEPDVLKWAAWIEETSNREIAQHKIGDVLLSTVFLGLDHSFGRGPPLLYETMIFGGEHDQEQWRYSTHEEAIEGHAKARALVGA